MRRMLAAVVMLAAALVAAPAHADTYGQVERTVVAGDSIVLGAGTSHPKRTYPARLAAELDQKVPSVGHGAGCLIAPGCLYGPSLIETYITEVLDLDPSRVVLSMGVNDLCHVPDEVLRSGYRLLWMVNNANHIETVFTTITPQNERWPWRCEEQRLRINSWLLNRFPKQTVDLAGLLDGPAGNLQKRYDAGDGLHPNDLGAQKMAHAVARAILRED